MFGAKIVEHPETESLPPGELLGRTVSGRYTCQVCTRDNHANYEELFAEIENCKSEEQEAYKSMSEQGHNPTNGTGEPDRSTTPTSSNTNLDADTDHQEATPTEDARTNREGQVTLDLDLETNIPLPSQARETETQLGLTPGRKHTNANPSSNTRNPRVCRYYRKGTCKHGVSQRPQQQFAPRPPQQAQQRPEQTTTATSHNNFLEMMLEMKHTMANLSKVVKAQGLLLQKQINQA
ncbi:hypothetical protein Pcinc_030476 [Petrolisthes cinctipes]|uniref:Uncharacterized protein n=1 Tax=Petrolisthes cinctipes TaxID=88211 RepID=A0AAE1K471_PETCI|nr:hypothetical protein Pcinc_030476 [Petrolisthes cinctipes]